MEKIEAIAVVETRGERYFRVYVQDTDETEALKKEPHAFFLAADFIPRAVAVTLEYWHETALPKVYRPVGEIMGRVDLKKKNGAPVKFLLFGGAHASSFPGGGAEVKIPLRNAICALIAYFAEHPSLDLSGYPKEFVDKFKGSWRKVLHHVSPVVPA